MPDLSALRTAWHTAQANTLEAMKHLLDNWNNPAAHRRYQRATDLEKQAEKSYLQALAGGIKPKFSKR